MGFPRSVLVVVQGDPLKSHRPVEALRIALGLASGDAAVRVMLLKGAVRLLSNDTDDVIDGDILEKYLPSIKEMSLPFLIPASLSDEFSLDGGFSVESASPERLEAALHAADRTLIF